MKLPELYKEKFYDVVLPVAFVFLPGAAVGSFLGWQAAGKDDAHLKAAQIAETTAHTATKQADEELTVFLRSQRPDCQAVLKLYLDAVHDNTSQHSAESLVLQTGSCPNAESTVDTASQLNASREQAADTELEAHQETLDAQQDANHEHEIWQGAILGASANVVLCGLAITILSD